MDDLVCSVDTREELDTFVKEASEIMESASMCLKKWQVTGLESEKSIKLLGIDWNTKSDEIGLNVDWWMLDQDYICETKRQLLSYVQKVFDPMGLVSPCTVIPKMLLQKLWKRKAEWDDRLEEEEIDKIVAWKKELEFFKEVRVPRAFGEGKRSVHVFCDASKSAYACVIYLLLETVVGENKVEFVFSKARVSPEGVSIPRLELMALVIGARMLKSLLDAVKWEDVEAIIWTDSTTVIQWIYRKENWSTFVRNRLEEIKNQKLIGEIRHVPGNVNPADYPSRGCGMKKLMELKWWKEPCWLRHREDWPKENGNLLNEEEINLEKKKVTCALTVTKEAPDLLGLLRKYSSFEKMVRILARVIQFIKRLRNKREKSLEILVSELEEAELWIFKWIQIDLGDGSRYKALDMIKENGVWKLRTRLLMRKDTELFRYPIVLPGGNDLVYRYIREQHVKKGHLGVQLLLNDLRERVWIVGARNVVRKVIGSCVICRRFKKKTLERPVPPLPENRIKDAACFEICGMDFCGPFFLRSGEKAWACLFTCAIYRAVHVELCLSLSTDYFIQAFRRFIARRGRPKCVYSDCGTNFVGAANRLETVNWSEVITVSSEKRIEWNFNTPKAPWWGGWWERLIGLLRKRKTSFGGSVT